MTSYTANISEAVTLSSSLPSTLEWVLRNIFITATVTTTDVVLNDVNAFDYRCITSTSYQTVMQGLSNKRVNKDKVVAFFYDAGASNYKAIYHI